MGEEMMTRPSDLSLKPSEERLRVDEDEAAQ
jgi:hypothetical protein